MIIRHLGLTEQQPIYDAMRAFTRARTSDTPDEIWVTQHLSVYTVGQAGREQHFPRVQTSIPVVRIDRGGQITFHGPGQGIVYVLVDISRRAITVRRMVELLEQSVIDLLGGYNIDSSRKSGAPGVYVGNSKIAALGLRVRHGCTYHGVALNIDMDLSPFDAIDPCGYPGQRVTQLRDLGVHAPLEEVSDLLARRISEAMEAQP